MASQKNYKTFQKNGTSSRNPVSNSGTSIPKPEGENDNSLLSKSCPAVLEPSKDESYRSHGRLKNALTGLFTRSCPLHSTEEPSVSSSGQSHSQEDEHYQSGKQIQDSTASCPLPSKEEPSVSSSGQSHSHEDEQHYQSREELRILFLPPNNEEQQRDEPWANCATFMESYKSYVERIRISWFIYIFQLFIGLICISEIVMGIIFFTSCEGDHSLALPIVGILMGILGLVLVCMWFATVLLIRRGDRFWNDRKNVLVGIFLAFFSLMILEIIYFSQTSPKTLQEERNEDAKCPKTYYDYLLYRIIVDAGCLLLAALLYLPDCCIYVRDYRRQIPSDTNGHVEPL